MFHRNHTKSSEKASSKKNNSEKAKRESALTKNPSLSFHAFHVFSRTFIPSSLALSCSIIALSISAIPISCLAQVGTSPGAPAANISDGPLIEGCTPQYCVAGLTLDTTRSSETTNKSEETEKTMPQKTDIKARYNPHGSSSPSQYAPSEF